jgi:DNA-binding HxlR family transcriptional regulator
MFFEASASILALSREAEKRMIEIPKPGQSVRGSRSGAPIMALFDLLGRRWAMGVLWTLSTSGPSTFRELQDLCETISPAVLNQRLKELQAAKFVEKTAHGYAATGLGELVYAQLLPLREAALAWASALNEEDASTKREMRKTAGG